ncbi:hypothetical protein ACFYV7_30860 [Nocardia suismassiliense]|uniref:Uncharacterized protein n=1 Tax=Nocardia suismassiliense TaxID=2077092 RepID=A0ABW6R1W8_9NOCA
MHDADADSVRLETLELSMAAAHPFFGSVTLELPDIGDNPPSLLRQSGDLIETWRRSMTVTFEKCGQCSVR